MPEGDVVWLTAQRLRAALAGRVLLRSDVRVPRHAAADLSGRQVTEVLSRGKHLLIRVGGADAAGPREADADGKAGDSDLGCGGGAWAGPLTVHTHLRMEGAWRIRPAGEVVRDSHRIRIILANDTWQAIGYQLGIVQIVPTAREDSVVGHLGPDLLGPDWDADEAVRRLRADPARPVGDALLDQRNLAGIGNFYKAEVLFLRGVSPWRPVGEVDDLGALVNLARRLLDANKERIGQVTTGVWRRGEESWVYGRAGLPCRRCRTPVRSADQGADARERVTYWCPRCQP